MTAPRVLVVEHQRDAGLGLVGERLAHAGVLVDQVGPDVGREVPDSLDGYDGLIVLGGSMGPTDDERAPWLPATRQLLAEGVNRELPTLGICLGAQLLVTATGGRVGTMPTGPEVGLQTVTFDDSATGDPLFGGFAGAEVPAVQWHWLAAEALPAQTEVFASSAACATQAFRIGPRAWGVQFHPEALGDTARDWADDTGDDLVELGLDGDAVVDSVRSAETELRAAWSQVADRFADQVAQQHASTASTSVRAV